MSEKKQRELRVRCLVLDDFERLRGGRTADAGTYFRLGMSGGEKKAASLCIAGNDAYSELKTGGTSHGG